MKYLRYILLFGGLLNIAVAFGFISQAPWAVHHWPWPDGRYSHLFIGSIFASLGAAALWIGWTGDLGALPAGTLNVFAIEVGAGLYFLSLALQGGRAGLLPYAGLLFLLALVSGGFFLWSRRLRLRDPRPTPTVIRISFGIFSAMLMLTAIALMLRLPIFPWKLNPDSSMVFGCIFLGDALYYLYGLLVPRLSNAIGQLLSFLVYDLVLIGPFLQLFASVAPPHRLSLIVYVGVLIFSALLAVHYLFIDPRTRGWLKPSRP
jgi:hypothetical protein